MMNSLSRAEFVRCGAFWLALNMFLMAQFGAKFSLCGELWVALNLVSLSSVDFDPYGAILIALNLILVDKHHLSSPPTGELEEAPSPQNCRGVVAKHLHCFVLEEERSSGVSGVNPVVVPNG
ncbi:hypothetical protein CEXT_474661 [Caerostris extrusa]|uniref:Uncharacterized protein n=1 Tax=Caerostris extrusa TaxID=172846 RepID=A0AAV4T6T3_CAEEX|nr:hypothetical protein CEXT_474661 [Caerostris extrusa]